MRIKLSFTVEEEDVLKEAAKILQLCGDDLSHAVSLFNSVQTELKGTDEDAEGPINTAKSLEMIHEFRTALLNVDIRLGEVGDIVHAFQGMQHEKHEAANAAALQPTPEEVRS